ncbi:hypothetical protein ABKN59_011051 [Abortiporus biennis]
MEEYFPVQGAFNGFVISVFFLLCHSTTLLLLAVDIYQVRTVVDAYKRGSMPAVNYQTSLLVLIDTRNVENGWFFIRQRDCSGVLHIVAYFWITPR